MKSIGITSIMQQAHSTSKDKGFYEHQPHVFPEKIALIHTEASEALEEWRAGSGDDKIAEELADIIIRVCDLAAFMDLDLGEAIKKKLAINKLRAYKHGGKRI